VRRELDVAALKAFEAHRHALQSGTDLEEIGRMKNDDADDTWDQCVTCIQCGSLLWPELDRSYHPSSDESLCFECSEGRGGVYDMKKGRWTRPPDLSGLVTRDAAS
jgi:hypothetical protein